MTTLPDAGEPPSGAPEGGGPGAERTAEDDAARALAGELALLIGRVNRRMLAAGRALGHGHLSALATILRAGPLRLGDLAAREVVSAPSMTRTVAELESRGLVVRRADPSDGRSVLVAVTPLGEDLVLRARSERAAILASLLAELDEGQREALRASLPALERLACLPLPGESAPRHDAG